MSYCVLLQDCWITVDLQHLSVCHWLSHITSVKKALGPAVCPALPADSQHTCSLLQPLAQMHRKLLAPANSLQCTTLLSLHVSISDLKQSSALTLKIHLACILSFRIRPFNSFPISISDSWTASDRSRILTKTGKNIISQIKNSPSKNCFFFLKHPPVIKLSQLLQFAYFLYFTLIH